MHASSDEKDEKVVNLIISFDGIVIIRFQYKLSMSSSSWVWDRD